MIRLTEAGLYCGAGGFHIDPWRPVDRAVVTHAHGDHLTWGCRHHLVSEEGARVTRARLGEQASIQAVPYGEPVHLNGMRVSLHPAGHILGSAQVRVEHRGEAWVVTGDYKTEPDATCVWNKLLTGAFRVGVSQRLITRALASVGGIEDAIVAHRLMGSWEPTSAFYEGLLAAEAGGADVGRPYPFFLVQWVPETDNPAPEPIGCTLRRRSCTSGRPGSAPERFLCTSEPFERT